MTDNEKRAHDLAISSLPHVMNEYDWKYLVSETDDTFCVNPEVFETYLDLYKGFLEKIKMEF